MKKYCLLFLIASLSNIYITLIAQTSGKYIVLDDNAEAGAYYARDSIILNPGFYFAPDNNTLELQICESWLFDVDYMGSQPNPDRALDKTLPVGSIPGSINVSPGGAATYQIPIFTPPGTAGVQPGVSIVYNSQAGNGVLGYGWNIAGLSAITRTPKTIYNDGVRGGIILDSTDRFSLDGNRLICTGGQYGMINSEYKTEVEIFAKIKVYDTVDKGPSYFIVETKDGKKLEYGSSTDSRVEAFGSRTVLLWRLNKVTDANGNYIEYHYGETNGESYITQISYTGNSAADISPYNRINFCYETREDQNTYYVAGSPVPQTLILRKIIVRCEEQIVREYAFGYTYDTYTHLSEVKETGSDRTRLNSTIINWGTRTPSLNTTNLNYMSDNVVGSGDFNGDGQTDLLLYWPVNYTWEFFLTKADGITFSSSGGVYLGPDYDYQDFFTPDVNGDGIDDLVIKCFDDDEDEYLYKFYVSSSTGHSISNDQIAYNYEHVLLTGDFTGDGLDDCLIINNNNGYWYLYSYIYSGGTLYALALRDSGTYEDWCYGSYYSVLKHIPIDINGNGIQEILIVDGLGYDVYEYNVSDFNNISTSNTFTNVDVFSWGDYNADGYTDFYYNNGSGGRIRFSNGNGYTDVIGGFSSYTRQYYEFYSQDMNGDGLMDLAALGYEGTSSYLHIAYSPGTPLAYYGNYIPSDSFDVIDNIHFVDLNGDGNIDFLYSDNGMNKLFSIYQDKANMLVKSITNGLNIKTSISYKSMTDDNNFYTKGSGSAFPVSDVQYPTYLVSSISSNNGVGGFNTTNYAYEAAKVHRQGAGYLGMGKFSVWNNITNIKTTQSFKTKHTGSLGTYYFPLTDTVKVVYMPGEVLSKTVNNYIIHEYGNKRIFPYVNTTVNDNFFHHTRNTTNSSVNTDGNRTTVTNTTVETAGSSPVTATTQTSYTNYIDAITGDGNTIPNRPQEITVTKTHSDQSQASFTNSTHFNYNNKGSLIQKTDYYNKPIKLYHKYEYYTTGNLKKNTDSASGCNSRYAILEYEQKYRFPIKQTDVLGNFSLSAYDAATGNITTTCDIYGNVTSYQYDGFGGLVETILPTGKRITHTINWYEGELPLNILYYSTIMPEGSGQVTEYYDMLGRSRRKIAKGYDGSDIVSTTTYNQKGQVISVASPSAEGSASLSTTYSYDNYGRMDQEIFDNTDTTDYNYDINNGRWVMVTKKNTNPPQSVEKTIGPLGNLKEVEDAGGPIYYKYHANHQLWKLTSSSGDTITIGYDDYGRQNSLNDPDAGYITYSYTPYGELATQTDANLKQYNLTYDRLGRILTKSEISEGITSYEYYTAGNGNTLLKKVTGPNGITESYTYDEFGRVLTATDSIESGHKYTTTFEYDDFGRNGRIIYPNNFSVKHTYNNFGYLSEVRNGSDNSLIWKGIGMNQTGQWTQYELGTTLMRTTKTYHKYGFTSTIKTQKISNSTYVQDLEYEYKETTGNMTSRTDHMHTYNGSALLEEFSYDELNRLTSFNNAVTGITTSYDDDKNGNISSKSDIGNMLYNGSKPHAVTQVSNPNSVIPSASQTIKYTNFNKVDTIIDAAELANLSIVYGPSQTRKKTFIQKVSTPDKTRYYSGLYEKDSTSSTTHEYCYIAGGSGLAAVYITTNGSGGAMYYIGSDHQGSINMLIDNTGAIAQYNGQAQEYSYDPWGRRRNPNDWSYNNVPSDFLVFRGFTGHEHLDVFKLINMNGRMYDPVLARFLSADNFIQNPGHTQSYNRYTYCLNNPLKYTDPSGWQYYSDYNDYGGRHPYTEYLYQQSCMNGKSYFMPNYAYRVLGLGDPLKTHYVCGEWYTLEEYNNLECQAHMNGYSIYGDKAVEIMFWENKHQESAIASSYYGQEAQSFYYNLFSEIHIGRGCYKDNKTAIKIDPSGNFEIYAIVPNTFIISDPSGEGGYSGDITVTGLGYGTAAYWGETVNTLYQKIESKNLANNISRAKGYKSVTGSVSKSLRTSISYGKTMTTVTRAAGRGFFVVGTAMTVYDMATNPTAENLVLGSADLIMGVVSIACPIVGLVYFTGRIIYDIASEE